MANASTQLVPVSIIGVGIRTFETWRRLLRSSRLRSLDCIRESQCKVVRERERLGSWELFNNSTDKRSNYDFCNTNPWIRANPLTKKHVCARKDFSFVTPFPFGSPLKRAFVRSCLKGKILLLCAFLVFKANS